MHEHRPGSLNRDNYSMMELESRSKLRPQVCILACRCHKPQSQLYQLRPLLHGALQNVSKGSNVAPPHETGTDTLLKGQQQGDTETRDIRLYFLNEEQ